MIEMVIIGGAVYQVTEVSGLEDDDAAYYGKVSYQHQAIQVEASLATTKKVQSLLHEVLHALFHETGHFDIEDEERVVQMLGCQLPRLLQDNDGLVQLLLQDERSLPDVEPSGEVVHDD